MNKEMTDEEILETAMENVMEIFNKEKPEEEKEITSKEAWGALFSNAGKGCKKATNASGRYFSRLGKAFAGKE